MNVKGTSLRNMSLKWPLSDTFFMYLLCSATGDAFDERGIDVCPDTDDARERRYQATHADDTARSAEYVTGEDSNAAPFSKTVIVKEGKFRIF